MLVQDKLLWKDKPHVSCSSPAGKRQSVYYNGHHSHVYFGYCHCQSEWSQRVYDRHATLYLVAKCNMGLHVGGKRPLTLPVQANGITSYFPTLPTKSEALRQFTAPRPATRLDPNSTPAQRHSSAARPSCAIDSDLQLSSSGECVYK